MTGPFVIKATSRINEGQAAAYRPLAQEICRRVEEQEPRILAFNIWVSEDEDIEVVLQVHPDAESLEYHLRTLGDLVRQTFEYTDFVSLEVYGPPSDRLRRMFDEESGDVSVTYYPTHWGGLTRLGTG